MLKRSPAAKVTHVGRQSTASEESMRTTIPLQLARALGVKIGDALLWELRTEVGGRRYLVVRKLRPD